jgi:phosphate uptake regulator
MNRLVLVAAVALAACTQSDNDRPATLEYITEAILQPNCGQYTCHSSFRRAKGYAFDTIAAAQASLAPTDPGAAQVINKSDPAASFLYQVLIRKVKRMPYDAPLPQKDIDLILKWIEDGAPGLDVP